MVFIGSFFVTSLAFPVLALALAVPLAERLGKLSFGARDILKRTTPAAPHFVVYHDEWSYPFPSATQLQVSETFSSFIPS
jgi:chitinase